MNSAVWNTVGPFRSEVESLLRFTGVHHEEQAFGKLRTDPPSRGGDAFSSADQEVRQQGDLLAVSLAQTISLPKEFLFFLKRETFLFAS